MAMSRRRFAQLKSGEGPDIQVYGSGELLQTLTGAGLIDEYSIWIFPLVPGAGNACSNTAARHKRSR